MRVKDALNVFKQSQGSAQATPQAVLMVAMAEALIRIEEHVSRPPIINVTVGEDGVIKR